MEALCCNAASVTAALLWVFLISKLTSNQNRKQKSPIHPKKLKTTQTGSPKPKPRPANQKKEREAKEQPTKPLQMKEVEGLQWVVPQSSGF